MRLYDRILMQVLPTPQEDSKQKNNYNPFKDIFSKCDQIRSFLRIWSHLLKKSLMENFIFFGSVIQRNFLLDRKKIRKENYILCKRKLRVLLIIRPTKTKLNLCR